MEVGYIKSIVIVAGGGRKVRYLVDLIRDTFEIFVIDLDKDVLDKLPSYPNIHIIRGDATSDYILRKAQIDKASYLVAFTDKEEINYEISLLGKNHNVPNIISYVPTYRYLEEFSKLGIFIVGGPKDAALFVYNKITHTKKAIGIGLGIDEIVEIVIGEYSPFANKTLSQIHLQGIRIGAIYRENELIVPTDNTLMKPADKILLIGYPKKLKYAANVILSTKIKFPIQYGNTVLALILKNDEILKELEFLKNSTAIQYLKGITTIENLGKVNFIDSMDYIQNRNELSKKLFDNVFGMVVIEKDTLCFLNKIGLKTCSLHSIVQNIHDAHIPVLVSSARKGYKKLLLYIFEDDEELIRKSINTAISIKDTLNIEMDTFVCEQSLKQSSSSFIQKVDTAAKRIFSIHKKRYKLNVVYGNPVKGFEKIKSSYDLAVISGFMRKNRFFKPNPAYYIANSSGISVFVILK